jgi:beta-galactosidase GanA
MMTTWFNPKALRNMRDAIVRRGAGGGRIVSAAFAILLPFFQIGFSQELKAETAPLPELRKVGRVTQLHVGGKPFLALGGELGNSTASDLAVLETALDKCQLMNLNTIMLPVYWDLTEPEEGKFNFTLVQGAIDRARAHNLRVVFLWFGTRKNSMSCYVPSWVKRDTARFGRAKRSSGETLEIISPESVAANEADARAFSTLMRWTKEYDSEKRTVINMPTCSRIGRRISSVGTQATLAGEATPRKTSCGVWKTANWMA